MSKQPALAASETPDATNRKNMALLVQLRWTAVLGQVGTIAFVHAWLGVSLPLWPMAAIIAALITLNCVSILWTRYKSEITSRDLLLALMLDVAALTAQLYCSGGATNPFTSLFLLQVTLGAVLLDARSIWSLVVLTCAALAGLTFAYRPLGIPPNGIGDSFSLYIAGMCIGFLLNAVLLVVFVTRINKNLREQDARLAAMRQHAAEESHIVRMGLLASGAAHELGTPLASISVLLSDWRRMPSLMLNPEIAADIAEMESSLMRCKAIVTSVLVSAGEARGEGSAATTVHKFVLGLADEWCTARSVGTLDVKNEFGADLAIASDAALKQVVFNVLDNALEASPGWIRLTAARSGDALVLRVEDRGPGFLPEMLTPLGKPYNSSKGRPGGGLGLFLVVNVIRKLGGHVAAGNRTEGGAWVTLTLPLTMLAIGGDDAG